MMKIGGDVEVAFARDFAGIRQVRHVLTEWVNGAIAVWICVDDPEPGIRMRINEKELELITGFPEVDFAFHLIPSMGREPVEIASNASVAYARV